MPPPPRAPFFAARVIRAQPDISAPLEITGVSATVFPKTFPANLMLAALQTCPIPSILHEASTPSSEVGSFGGWCETSEEPGIRGGAKLCPMSSTGRGKAPEAERQRNRIGVRSRLTPASEGCNSPKIGLPTGPRNVSAWHRALAWYLGCFQKIAR